jgi:virulence factor Mce-like protein
MVTRRLIINLIVFFAVSFALVGYGIVNLLGNPLSSPTTLTTNFPDASGLYAGFEVELNGVPVGTVSSTALTKHATTVAMSIDPGVGVPDDVQASVQIANDLGEQVVNLVPSRGGPAPDLKSGATVPWRRTRPRPTSARSSTRRPSCSRPSRPTSSTSSSPSSPRR